MHVIATHPYGIPFMGGIASIVAIPLALLLWKALPRHRELTYAIQPIRTTLAQSIENIHILVSFQGKDITNDLNVAQVMLFNAGREPIESSDIVQDISLVVSNASILAVSYSVPPKAGTDIMLHTNAFTDRIVMHWKILEKGDKPVFQVLYAGKRDAPITLEGRIKGQESIPLSSWEYATIGVRKKIVKTIAVLCIFPCFMLWIGVLEGPLAKIANKKYKLVFSVLWVLLFVLFGAVIGVITSP